MRKETTIRFSAVAPYPVITFGPYPNPEALMVTFASVIGTLTFSTYWLYLQNSAYYFYSTLSCVMKLLIVDFHELFLDLSVAFVCHQHRNYCSDKT